MGGPEIKLDVSEHQRESLNSMTQSASRSLARRALIILMAADGYSTTEIAAHCKVSAAAVSMWKKRFAVGGMSGLYAEASAHHLPKQSDVLWDHIVWKLCRASK